MPGLQQLLRELRAGFGGLCSSVQEAQRLASTCVAADEAYEAFTKRASQEGGDQDLQREVIALAEQLAAFNRRLAAWPAEALVRPAAQKQLTAACKAFSLCIDLGHKLSAPPNAAFCLACASSLVLETGTRALSHVMQHAQLDDASLSPEWAQLASLQLSAVEAVVTRLLLEHRRAEAAFAGSTGRPEALLPWLAVTAQALSIQQGAMPQGVASDFANLVDSLVCEAAYRKHAAALDRNPNLQHSVADLLLDCCLPNCAEAASAAPAQLLTGETAGLLLTAIGRAVPSPALRSAALQRVLGPPPAEGQAHGKLSLGLMARLAGGLVLLLPVSRPESVQLREYIRSYTAGLDLLAFFCGGSCSAEIEPATAASRQQLQAAAWEGVRLVPRLADVLQVLEVDRNNCSLLMLKDVCDSFLRLASALNKLSGLPRNAGQLEGRLAAALSSLRLQPLLLQWEPELQQLLSCSGTGQASTSAGSASEQRTSPFAPLARALLNLAFASVASFDSCLPAAASGAAGTGGSAAKQQSRSMTRKLWQLHTTACRLAHWLFEGEGRPLAEEQGMRRPSFARALLCQLNWLLVAVAKCAAPDGSCNDPSPVLASVAAHREAFSMLAAAAAETDPEQGGAAYSFGGSGDAWRRSRALAGGLVAMGVLLPGSVSPAFVDTLRTEMDGLSAGTEPFSRLHALVSHTAFLASQDEPRLAATTVSSGLLGEAVDACAELAAGLQNSSDAEEAAGRVKCPCCAAPLADQLSSCTKPLRVLASAAEQAAGSLEAAEGTATEGAASDEHAGLRAELLRASGRLSAGLQAVPQPGEVPLQAAIDQLQQLLPAAAETAAALQRFWALPEQQAAARLELARAAVRRSCANQRCPNVGLEGGPEAGGGQGCKVCTGCRAAWYCSAACQKADWGSRGGGHRLVCALLRGRRR